MRGAAVGTRAEARAGAYWPFLVVWVLQRHRRRRPPWRRPLLHVLLRMMLRRPRLLRRRLLVLEGCAGRHATMGCRPIALEALRKVLLSAPIQLPAGMLHASHAAPGHWPRWRAFMRHMRNPLPAMMTPWRVLKVVRPARRWRATPASKVP